MNLGAMFFKLFQQFDKNEKRGTYKAPSFPNVSDNYGCITVNAFFSVPSAVK